MEERLDKLISLMESQNKAWERSLQMLNAIHSLMVEKYKAADLLLEQHPPIRSPSVSDNRETTATEDNITNTGHPLNFNDYSDSTPYGVEVEEERAPVAQSFPLAPNAVPPPDQPATSGVGREEIYTTPEQQPHHPAAPPPGGMPLPQQQPQEPFKEAPPEVPLTSKAEMMEQAEKSDE